MVSADSPSRKLHPRALLPVLRSRLASRPVVVLTGARQTGKTTLVRDLLDVPEGRVYLSLDDPDERLRLAADPVRRLDHGTKLVVLDEVQKLPALMDAVKLLADRGGGRKFLLLGSSHVLLLSQVRESLAGRAALLELWPLALAERTSSDAVPASGLDLVWRRGEAGLRTLAEQSPRADAVRAWASRTEEHLRWGGYPALEPLGEEDRAAWLRDFRRTYLERDLADLGRVADLDQFALAQNLLAARTAQLLSYSEVARELGVAVNTVKRYLRFLEISYQAYLLRPMLPTMTGRLVKSPKVYWTDPGLARLLAEQPDPLSGAMFETAVLDELLRWRSWQSDPPALHFHRTAGGREVDFVMHSPKRLLAIEAKTTARLHPGAAAPLGGFLHDGQAKGLARGASRIGLVVTRGRETRELDEHIWEVPFQRLFGPALADQ